MRALQHVLWSNLMAQFTTPVQLPVQCYAEYVRDDMPGVQVHANSSFVGALALPRVGTLTKVVDYKTKILRGVDASSPYFRRDVQIRPLSYYVQNFGTVDTARKIKFNGFGRNRPYIDPTTFVSTADDAALKDLALKRLKQKLAGRSNQTNLLIPVVELREMRGMLTNIAVSGADLVRALIAIKKSKGASAWKFASHAWLNWSFGIAPTLGEIHTIAESIQSFMDNQGAKYTDYGAAKKQWVSSHKGTLSCAYKTTDSWSSQATHTLSYRYICGFRTKIRSANDYGLASHFGLEFGAMIPAVWELTPFSWLFDYFSTMGDYLEDTFVSDSTSSVYVNLNKRYTCKGQIIVDVRGTSGVDGMSVNRTPGTYDILEFTRTPLSQLPSRSLRLKTSDEIGKNAVNKVLNLASILAGGVGRGYKTLY